MSLDDELLDGILSSMGIETVGEVHVMRLEPDKFQVMIIVDEDVFYPEKIWKTHGQAVEAIEHWAMGRGLSITDYAGKVRRSPPPDLRNGN